MFRRISGHFAVFRRISPCFAVFRRLLGVYTDRSQGVQVHGKHAKFAQFAGFDRGVTRILYQKCTRTCHFQTENSKISGEGLELKVCGLGLGTRDGPNVRL